MKLAILLSLIFHITLLLSYKIPKPITQPRKPKQAKIKIKLKKKIAKTKDSNTSNELYMLNDIMSKLFKDLEKEKRDQKFVQKLLRKNKCTKYYRGIGIFYSGSLYQRIIKIGANTPAERAGLQIGDKLVDRSPIRNIYPIGTVLTLPVIRNGIMLHINVTVGKICTN